MADVHRAEDGGAGRRIVVYRIGYIGDTVIALPALWAVRHHFPNAHILFLGNNSDRSSDALAQSVLPADGLCDQWLTYPTGTGRRQSLRAVWTLVREMRRQRLDTLVYLAPRQRSRAQVWRDLALFFAAGIRHFIGHQGCVRSLPRADGEVLPQTIHEADHLLERVNRSGVSIPAAGQRSMALRLTDEEQHVADAWMTDHCGPALAQKRVIGVGPGSKWSSKLWSEDNYAAVGAQLIAEHQLFPVVFGGPDDAACGERLIARWGRGANAAGRMTVRQSAAALQRCRFYVGNDTGTMHLAAAVGTPCVAVFAAIDWPGRWSPYGVPHVVLREAVPCEGCLQRVCPLDSQCLRAIEVKSVVAACRQFALDVPDECVPVE